MDDESIFEVFSSEFDSLLYPDNSLGADSIDSEVTRVTVDESLDTSEPEPQTEQGSADSSPGFSDSSSVDVVLSDGSSIEVREDSSPEAVTPVSSVSVTMDNSDILYRMERLEGCQVSLLYTQYILISLLISGFIIKMIFHFTSFDR